MIELLQCPHGGGPFHLLFDLWWLLILAVPGVAKLVARVLKKFGYSVRHLCCGHTEVKKGKRCTSEHCHGDHE